VSGPVRPAEAGGGDHGGIFDREGALSKLLIAPAVIYIAAMIGAPFVLAILYSLSDATTGDPGLRLVGLRNFGRPFRIPSSASPCGTPSCSR